MATPRIIETFPQPFGKYELLDRIGDGGMAEVFRARLPGVGGFEKILVIKRILPELQHKKDIVDMFVAEATLAAQVQHKNVVQVFELDRLDDGEHFMVMEYVEGTDLRRVLKAAALRKLRIPPWFSVHVMIEILDGLSFAHELKDKDGRLRNVVHRDVTPSNVFISHLGDVKLGDFGVAKDDARVAKTITGTLKGKIPYMSPEQLYHRPIDRRTDVFSAGIVLWESLTQRRLFGGHPEIETMNLICKGIRPPPSRYKSDLFPELDECLLKALEIDPEKRFPSARDFQDRLLEILPAMRARVLPSDVRGVVDVFLSGSEAESAPDSKVIRSDSSSEGSRPFADSSVEKAALFDPSSAMSWPLTGTYRGLHPFFIRRDQEIGGPHDYFDALVLLRSSVEAAPTRSVMLSANREKWIDLARFASLTGQEALFGDAWPDGDPALVLPDDAPITLAGRLEERSFAHILGVLAREKLSGRLSITKDSGGRKARREIHVLRGQPMHVRSNLLKLQMPEFLVQQNIVTSERLTELVHLSVLEDRPLEDVVAEVTKMNIDDFRAVFMKERLVDVTGWSSGEFVFDSSRGVASGKPFAPTLLALLPDLVYRGVSISHLRDALEPHLDRPLSRSNRFARGVRDMMLHDLPLAVAQRLGGGEPVRRFLEADPKGEKIYLSMAYIFVETGLLLIAPDGR